jgi:hypothetical protein
MGSIDAKLQRVARFGWVRSVAKVVAASLPFGIGAMTFIQGLSDEIPLSVIIALAMLALASCAVLLNQLAVIAGFPVTVTMPDDYAHGVGVGHLWIALEPDNDVACFQLGVELINATPRPMRYLVKRFDITIKDRVTPVDGRVTGGGLLKAAARLVYRQTSFTKEAIGPFIGTKQPGLIEMEILYGHPDRPPSRRYSTKLALTTALVVGGPSATYSFLEETDEPI